MKRLNETPIAARACWIVKPAIRSESQLRRVVLQLALFAIFAGCSGCEAGKFGAAPSSPSGAVIWVAPGSAIGQPAVDDTTVYFGTTDHHVIAVQRQTGAQRWTTTTGGRTPRTLNGQNVIVAAGNVIFGDYAIYAFDRATGAARWVFDPEKQGIAGYAPGAYELRSDGTTIYAGSGSGHAYAINAADGSLVWVTPLAVDGHSSVYDPVLDGNTVYVTVRHFTNPITGAVFALDRATGAVKWSHIFSPPTPETGSGPLDKVIVFGNTIIVSVDDGKIYWLNKITGLVEWTAPRLPDVTGLDDSRPIILVGTTLVAGSTTFEVTGYDAMTGRFLWQANGGQGASTNTLATYGDVVYVAYNNGVMGAFDAGTGTRRWIRSAPNGGLFTGYPFAAADAIFAPSTDDLVAMKE